MKRESTVTLPSGLHVGHYKVSTQCEEIAEIHRVMMILPFQYGFSPIRWCNSVQMMLQKDPSLPWIHRLCIIELFDTSFNAALMILVGRKLIHHANDNMAIHKSAFGSVPGRTAQSALLQKKLSIDVLRQDRICGTVFECDATGCFDIILPQFQTIHTRRMGLVKNTAVVIAQTLQKMKRYVGTKYGISKKYIKTNLKELRKRLFGTGQGSGCGPAVWLCHLVVLFEILEKNVECLYLHLQARIWSLLPEVQVM